MIFHENLSAFIETLKRAFIVLEEIEKQEKSIDYFETFVRHIMNARNDLEIIDVYEVVTNVSLERSNESMIIAERLIKEGMEKGILEGQKNQFQR